MTRRALLLVPIFALAQEPDFRRWQRLSPADRQRFLNRLPPARRRLFEQRMQSISQMNENERRALGQRFERFQKLPPDQQAQAREAFAEFQKLPLLRKQRIRRALRSPQFAQQLPRADRRILEGLSLLGPDQD